MTKTGEFSPRISAATTNRIIRYCKATNQNKTRFVEKEWCGNARKCGCIERLSDDMEWSCREQQRNGVAGIGWAMKRRSRAGSSNGTAQSRYAKEQKEVSNAIQG